MVPAPPGSCTSRTRARVSTSSGNREVMTDSSSIEVLPQDSAAHAHSYAHRGQAEADVRSLGQLPGELDHQPGAGAGQRVAERDRAAPRVHPRVVVVDLEVVEEGEYLDRERLVDLDPPDVVDGQVVAGKPALGGGDGADAHHLGVDPGEAEVH